MRECLTFISQFDFPDKWQSLTVDINNALNSKKRKEVYAGLMALLGLVKQKELDIEYWYQEFLVDYARGLLQDIE